VATNDDPIYPSADGPSPGSGAILASVERATGHRAELAGKPHEPIAEVIRQRFGSPGVMVGDSPSTDGGLASALGWPFGLVLTGNTTADTVPIGLDADWIAPDLAALVERHLAG
jgi:4-nitrophenyl phosphatase